jgi:hypothetical protein
MVGRTRRVTTAGGALSLLAFGLLLVGCSGSSAPHASTIAPPRPTTSAAPPAECTLPNCQRAQTVALTNGYSVSIWHAGKVGDFTTHPLVELTSSDVPVQSLIVKNGYGWAGSVTCETKTTDPGCVLIDGQGAHSGTAQEIVLRGGRLAPTAMVASDSPTIVARDIDGDGDLDVEALDSDYTPNYAAGHLIWHTYRLDGDQLASTGCSTPTSAKSPPPNAFATGSCPTH